MENVTILDNATFHNFIQQKQHGWSLISPPILEPFWFEKQTPFANFDWMKTHANAAYYIGAVYIVTIFSLQFWMKHRCAYDLRRPLMYWNGVMGLFSIVAFLRMAPSLLYTINQPNGLYTSVCVKKDIDLPTVYWSYLFATSKFFELGDTIFIVLRKRPLKFIQWFHHLVTMIVTWLTTPPMEPVSRWYADLNAGVHAVMYPYFSLRAGGVKIPAIIATFITTIQFLQMWIGLGVNVVSMYLYESGSYECYRHPFSVKVWGILYSCFVLLFGKLFYDNVLAGKKQKTD